MTSVRLLADLNVADKRSGGLFVGETELVPRELAVRSSENSNCILCTLHCTVHCTLLFQVFEVQLFQSPGKNKCVSVWNH
jgi:hypothetical protein